MSVVEDTVKEDNSLRLPLLDDEVVTSSIEGSESKTQKVDLYSNFVLLSFAFSVNHGCAAACIAYSTAELGNFSGSVGSGLLYLFYSISALFFSVPVVEVVSMFTIYTTEKVLFVSFSLIMYQNLSLIMRTI